MKDPNQLSEPEGTPEDIATLYSWANLHGAKYRDFSAARAQTREKARLRAEQALTGQGIEGVGGTGLDEGPAAPAPEIQSATEQPHTAHENPREIEGLDVSTQEEARDAEEASFHAEWVAAHQAAGRAAEQAREEARQAADQAAELAAQQASEDAAKVKAAEIRAAQVEADRVEAARVESARVEAEGIEAERIEAARAAEQAAKVEAEQAARHAAEKAESAAREAAERAAQLEATHTAQLAEFKAAQRAAEEAAHKAAEQAAQLEAQLAAEHAARIEAEEAARRAAEEAVRQAAQLEAQRAAELAARLEAEQAALRAAQQAEQEAAERAARLAAEQAEAARVAEQMAVQKAAEEAEAARVAEQMAAQKAAEEAAARAAQQQAAEKAAEVAEQLRAWQQPAPERSTASPFAPAAASVASPAQRFDFDHPAPPREQPQGPGANLPLSEPHKQAHHEPHYAAQQPPVHEESSMPPRNPWATPDMPEAAGKPAWLTQDRNEASSEAVSPSSLPATPEDTLQGSRDRLTSRWFALRGIFDAAPPPPEPPPAPVTARAPAMAVFSLAGGVGKTSLVATLGRALSARGERVLLVDTAAFGLLPFFFGATDQRPGLLRTFSPPGVSSDAPVQMVTLDPDGMGNDANSQESLSGEITKFSRGASRVIIDLATASGSTTRRIMRMAPLVLVPVIPDMNSVVSVSSIDAFFEHNSNPNGKPSMPYYVLNQFDASLPLNLDVREVLREQLAERLLPFALRRTPAMSEALAEGMTVMDYAPNSSLAEDFSTLAGWVRSLSAPATTSYRGVRWSER